MKKAHLLSNDPILDALDARLAMNAPSVAAIASAGQGQTGQEIMGMMTAMSAGRSAQPPVVQAQAEASSLGPAIAAGAVGLVLGGAVGAALAGSSNKTQQKAVTPSSSGHAPVTMTTFKRQAGDKVGAMQKTVTPPKAPATQNAGEMTVPAAPKPEKLSVAPVSPVKPVTTPPTAATSPAQATPPEAVTTPAASSAPTPPPVACNPAVTSCPEPVASFSTPPAST
jgi:hypothetical protein